MKLFLSTLSCVFFLVGCGTKDSASDNSGQRVDQQNNPNAVNLAGKSTSEILDLKYNKAVLKCALWSQSDKNINLAFTPNDTATLDLKNNPALPQLLELSANIDNHEIKISIETVKLFHYGVLNHTDSAGNKVVAQYSPYVEIKFSSFSKNYLANGEFTSSSGSSRRTVQERIVDVALNSSVNLNPVQSGTANDSVAFSDYASCIIETDIKPDYRYQYTFTPAPKN